MAEGDGLLFVNLDPPLSYRENITTADPPVHPKVVGDGKMAKVWFDALTSRVLPVADVLTQRNNNLRTGVSSWPGLDQFTVKNFQLLHSFPVDAPVLAQPLVVQSQDWKGNRLSVLWIATAINTIYAFNADPPFQQLQKLSLGPVYSPPFDEKGQIGGPQLTFLKPGSPGIIGIESSPVIDLISHTMFVSYRTGSTKLRSAGQQHLAAIDITTGLVKQTGRVKDDVVVPGSDGWYKLHRNRASLLLDNHIIYIAFAGIVEYNVGKTNGYGKSWQGWIHAFDAGNLSPLGAYRTMHHAAVAYPDPLKETPDGGGIWQGSGGLGADGSGNLAFGSVSGNKDPSPPDPENLSRSVIRLRL